MRMAKDWESSEYEGKMTDLPHIPMFYDPSKGDQSALELVYEFYPGWKTDDGSVNLVRFTGGIMNTLLKITKQVPGCSESQNDEEAILLRAYGDDSDILVDREMEVRTHMLLAKRGLATPLLARFENGLLYQFLPGHVCAAHDLVKEPVWRAVAARLGEWHAKLPLSSISTIEDVREDRSYKADANECITSRFRSPNIWTVLHKWVSALPARTDDEKNRKSSLQKELKRFFGKLYHEDQADDKFVLGHCDLLSANVLISPESKMHIDGASAHQSLVGKVHFIDYEYAVPCPPAFDLANHFSEWGGFECDYNMLPPRATRRAFIEEYLRNFSQHKPSQGASKTEVEELLAEVDRFRGIPGFYWGIQSLIQATISSVDFDWVDYAEMRLAEFWAWRREEDGGRIRDGKEMPLRERRWAQES